MNRVNDIDLHMHTSHSVDGEILPAELMKRCKDAGLTLVAVTDHNKVTAVEEARAEAEKYGMRYICATEINCMYKGQELHVAGYGIDIANPAINELGESYTRQSLALNDRKIEMVNRLGFEVTKEQMEAISPDGIFIGERFAEALLNDSRYTEHALLKPYRKGGDRSDNPYLNFFWDYFAQGKPCFAEVVWPSLESALDIIRDCGGVSVLAHPGQSLKGNYGLFDEIVDSGVQGVEAFSSYHTPEASEYFLKKGRAYNLLITCGSDFHGKTKPASSLGGHGCTIDQREIEARLREYGLLP